MAVVGIKALKDQLSAYVRLAAGGERVLVTDRDRVVAELVQPQNGTPNNRRAAVRADLIARGMLIPRKVPLDAPPPPRMPKRYRISHQQLMEEIERDREDRV